MELSLNGESIVFNVTLFVHISGQSIVGRDGVIIDCRTEHDSYFPDPDDCTMFYHCSDWAGLEHKSCGPLYFHPQKNVCDWPSIVRRVRHDCPRNDPDPLRVELITSDEVAEEPVFDDGSYVEFEPKPQNRWRRAIRRTILMSCRCLQVSFPDPGARDEDKAVVRCGQVRGRGRGHFPTQSARETNAEDRAPTYFPHAN